MKLQLLEHARRLASSYWFIPLLCSVLAVVLVWAAAQLDASSARGTLPTLPYFRDASAAGARAILATIAGSAISVAGVVFSISMVVLSTASAQLGPRLLPNFFRRKSTQLVLGGFLATFIAALLVLVQLTDSGDGAQPHAYALAVCVALAIGSFALLVYFLHSMTSFIQAPRVIDEVGDDLARTLRRATREDPPEDDAKGEREALEQRCDTAGAPLAAPRGGYLQAIDVEAALQLAHTRDLVLRALRRELARLFVIDLQRSHAQDVEFAVEQLTEIALRALSPGINDPYTAIHCIDRLGDALAVLGARHFPAELRRDAHGVPRLLLVGHTEEGVLDAAFNPLRQHGCAEAAVALRLLETIGRLARRGPRERVRGALGAHLERIHDAAREACRAPHDRHELEERYRAARRALEDSAAAAPARVPA